MKEFKGRSFNCSLDEHEPKYENAEFNVKVKNGVYIQDVNGNLWKTKDWDDSVKANAIAVITPQHKFRIALTGTNPFQIAMLPRGHVAHESALPYTKDENIAKTCYYGVSNTQHILRRLSSQKYAAGWCAAYIFPDGTTDGYLPDLGELYLAYQNKAEIGAALEKCGGAAMEEDCYWSSMFYGVDKGDLMCWALDWLYGYVGNTRADLGEGNYVRPFATLEI